MVCGIWSSLARDSGCRSVTCCDDAAGVMPHARPCPSASGPVTDTSKVCQGISGADCPEKRNAAPATDPPVSLAGFANVRLSQVLRSTHTDLPAPHQSTHSRGPKRACSFERGNLCIQTASAHVHATLSAGARMPLATWFMAHGARSTSSAKPAAEHQSCRNKLRLRGSDMLEKHRFRMHVTCHMPPKHATIRAVPRPHAGATSCYRRRAKSEPKANHATAKQEVKALSHPSQGLHWPPPAGLLACRVYPHLLAHLPSLHPYPTISVSRPRPLRPAARTSPAV